MTIREAISSYPGVDNSDSFIDTVLVNRSISSESQYSVSEKSTVELAVADIYAHIGGLPDFTENKLSMSYPRSWYTAKAKELYIANGEELKANSLGNSIQVPRGRSGRRW